MTTAAQHTKQIVNADPRTWILNGFTFKSVMPLAVLEGASAYSPDPNHRYSEAEAFVDVPISVPAGAAQAWVKVIASVDMIFRPVVAPGSLYCESVSVQESSNPAGVHTTVTTSIKVMHPATLLQDYSDESGNHMRTMLCNPTWQRNEHVIPVGAIVPQRLAVTILKASNGYAIGALPVVQSRIPQSLSRAPVCVSNIAGEQSILVRFASHRAELTLHSVEVLFLGHFADVGGVLVAGHTRKPSKRRGKKSPVVVPTVQSAPAGVLAATPISLSELPAQSAAPVAPAAPLAAPGDASQTAQLTEQTAPLSAALPPVWDKPGLKWDAAGRKWD